ncbi:hypothetical protein FQR65_LT17003 [Abscondita terminalis]|nr:hypothetical protein FQR65_LT17003 [Abscondita terminalis]
MWRGTNSRYPYGTAPGQSLFMIQQGSVEVNGGGQAPYTFNPLHYSGDKSVMGGVFPELPASPEWKNHRERWRSKRRTAGLPDFYQFNGQRLILVIRRIW